MAALATIATVLVMRRQGRNSDMTALLEMRAQDPVARLSLSDDLTQWRDMLQASLDSLFADISIMSEIRAGQIDDGHPIKPRADLFPSAPSLSRYEGSLVDVRNHARQLERASREIKTLLPAYARTGRQEESDVLARQLKSADYLAQRLAAPESVFLSEARRLLIAVLDAASSAPTMDTPPDED